MTPKIKTVFAYKRGLEKVFWGNDHLYVEVFGHAHPKTTTRTPRNPFSGPFLARFRFYKNPDYIPYRPVLEPSPVKKVSLMSETRRS